MVFNSLEFLVFFAVVVGLYYAVPHRARWVLLLAASGYFYGLLNPIPLLQLLLATAGTYYLAIKIEGTADKPAKSRLMKIGIVLLALNLIVFKYTGFVTDSLRNATGWFGVKLPLPVVQIALPLGISFYTFQLIAYLVDVARGAKAERHAGIFALFITFFPKLVAGPIERAKNLLPQLHAEKAFDYQRVVAGLQLMLWGFFQKLVVADRLAPFVKRVYDNPQNYEGAALTMATWLFAFQVYCDFRGYTDIARGAAQTMGYDLMQNFDHPYFAISVADFWKRWHISLSSWLTDYVYTPLSRQRKFKLKLYYTMLGSLLITFLVSGFWHGAQWTFVAWGGLHGIYLVSSMMSQKLRVKCVKAVGLDKSPKVHRIVKIAITFGLVCFSYPLFKANSISDAFYVMTHFLSGWGHAPSSVSALLEGQWPELLMALLGIAVVMAVDVLQRYVKIRQELALRPAWLRWSVYHAAAAAVVLLGAFYGTNQDFIYFQF